MECKASGWASRLSDCPSPRGVRTSLLISACGSRYCRLPLSSACLGGSVLTIALQPIIFQIPELCSQRSVGCFSGTFILLADYLPPRFLPCKLPPPPTPPPTILFSIYLFYSAFSDWLTFLAPQILNSSHHFISSNGWKKTSRCYYAVNSWWSN